MHVTLDVACRARRQQRHASTRLCRVFTPGRFTISSDSTMRRRSKRKERSKRSYASEQYDALVDAALAESLGTIPSPPEFRSIPSPTAASICSSVLERYRGRPILYALLQEDASWEGRACADCGSVMRLFVGRCGPFTKCMRKGCAYRAAVPLEQLDLVVARLVPMCGQCGGELRSTQGRYGPYLLCRSCGNGESWRHLKNRLRQAKKQR